MSPQVFSTPPHSRTHMPPVRSSTPLTAVASPIHPAAGHSGAAAYGFPPSMPSMGPPAGPAFSAPPAGPPTTGFSMSANYDITRGHAGRSPQTPLMPIFSASGTGGDFISMLCLQIETDLHLLRKFCIDAII